jgi:hypothetical protein
MPRPITPVPMMPTVRSARSGSIAIAPLAVALRHLAD